MNEGTSLTDIGRKIAPFLPQTVVDKTFSMYAGVAGKAKYHARLSGCPDVPLSGKNVIIIAVDCLRSDHTSLLDYKRDTTPFLSDVGTSFPNAISAAPWTFPSVSSILTGLYPHNHGATFSDEYRNFDRDDLPNSIRTDTYTLSELLGANGYSTYFTSAIITASLPVQGRFSKMDVQHNAPADEMIDRFLDWWCDHDTRFGYLHLGDLHQPLLVPPDQPFGDIPEDTDVTGWKFRETTSPEAEFERYRERRFLLYDTLIRFVDRQIERLFHVLEDRGELENTCVVVVGDHGEGFWEHAAIEREHYQDPRGYHGVGHGHSLFQEVTNVPLFVSGFNSEGACDDRISTVDIFPTLLTELAANDYADDLPRVDGSDVFVPGEQPILSEGIAYGYEKKAVIEDGYKLIHSFGDEPEFLFDLSRDEDETENLQNSQKREELRVLLPLMDESSNESIEMDDQTESRLEDLGYI